MSGPDSSGRTTRASSTGASSRKRPSTAVAEPDQETVEVGTTEPGAGSLATNNGQTKRVPAGVRAEKQPSEPDAGETAEPDSEEPTASEATDQAVQEESAATEPDEVEAPAAGGDAAEAVEAEAAEPASQDEVGEADVDADAVVEASPVEPDAAAKADESPVETAEVDESPAETAEDAAESAAAAPVAQDGAATQIDPSTDPIEVASRFDPLGDIPSLANVDEMTMPEMASVMPEPDLHLRPAFQPVSDVQYGSVSAFRRDRIVGASARLPATESEAAAPAEASATAPTDAPAETETAPSRGPFESRPMPVRPPVEPVRPPVEPVRPPVEPVRPAPAYRAPDTAAMPSPATPTVPPLHAVPSAPTTPRTYDADQAEPAPQPAPARPTQPRRRPRRARLKLSRVDPWTVMKIAFLFSLALAIMTLIAVALLWTILNAMGVFSDVGRTVSDITGSGTGESVDVEGMFTLSRILKFTGLLVIMQTIVLTCLATLGAFLYNASSGLVGGVEITLTEAD